jgi:hypothetical protein
MPASQEHLHELLLHCMNFARERLAQAGDFYPFGATVSAAGQLQDAPGYPGGGRPKPHEIYDFLVGLLKAGAGEGRFLGVALAANVNIPDQFKPAAPDGIRVLVETQGYARYVYVPYHIGRDDAREDGGEARGQGSGLRVFAPFSVQVPPEFYPK